MFKRNRNDVSRRERQGLTSYLLLQKQDEANSNLLVTWVELAPGARQIPHHHLPEQVYVIIQGQAIMQVGDEEQVVAAGDLVHIPSKARHGLRNTGESMLLYISAATPSLDAEAAYDSGMLAAENYLNP